MVAQHLLRGHVRLLDHAPDLVVDLARHFVRVVGFGAVLTPHEGLVVRPAENARAQLLAHAEAHHHLLGKLRHPLEIVGRTRRYLFEDDLLGRATAEGHPQLLHQLGARRQVAILARKRDRVAERLPAADDRDLVDVLGSLQEVPDERVPHLVVGGDLALLL